jgi:hypothetical protein
MNRDSFIDIKPHDWADVEADNKRITFRYKNSLVVDERPFNDFEEPAPSR